MPATAAQIRSHDEPVPGTADARLAIITIARPDKKNALTPAMLATLHEHISSHTAQARTHAILLEGEGAAFCSGFDLSLCKENSDALRELLTGLSRVIRLLRSCPMPIVIAAHGAALAGGCALLGGADVVVTHNDCKVGYPVVRLGISPAVSAPTLSLGIGHGPTRERLLSSQIISGWDAYRLGLAHECIDDAGKVRERAHTIALQLASKPTHAMRQTKLWLNEVDGSLNTSRLDAGLNTSLSLVGCDEERARLTELWKSSQ